jgi:hypothetical protein
MKKKTIKPKLNKKTGEYFIKLKHFKDYIDDVSLIDSYKLEPIEDLVNGVCLLLSFYDKDGKLIEAKEPKE